MEIPTELRENIKAYHTNTQKKCQEFLTGKMIISSDETFLGKGMYFWDNKANANYWKGVRSRNTKEPVEIVSAQVYIDSMLDLTDETVVSNIIRQWEKYCRKDNKKSSYKAKEKYKIGYVLDVLPVLNKIPVRRSVLNYTKGNNSLNYFAKQTNVCKATTTSRLIYSVIQDNVIVNRRAVKDDE